MQLESAVRRQQKYVCFVFLKLNQKPPLLGENVHTHVCVFLLEADYDL